jgi:hypothetical protein
MFPTQSGYYRTCYNYCKKEFYQSIDECCEANCGCHYGYGYHDIKNVDILRKHEISRISDTVIDAFRAELGICNEEEYYEPTDNPVIVTVDINISGIEQKGGYPSDPQHEDVDHTKSIKVKVLHSKRWRKDHLKNFIRELIPDRTYKSHTDFGCISDELNANVKNIHIEGFTTDSKNDSDSETSLQSNSEHDSDVDSKLLDNRGFLTEQFRD